MSNPVRVDARFAEQIIAPDYRSALNGAFETSPTRYAEQRDATQLVILGSLLMVGAAAPDEKLSWEMRRQAALARMDGKDFGPFDDYLIRFGDGGSSQPVEVSQLDLGNGAPGPVSTNSRILTLHQTESDPSLFFSTALDTIDHQKSRKGISAIGPENYASAIKFYVDKRFQNPGTKISPEEREQMKGLVTRCLTGLEIISRHDEPNVIELTNVYSVIHRLPLDVVDPRFTPMLVKLGLSQLRNFDSRAAQALFAAMGKMDLYDVGDAAATLFDLALRKTNLETTAQMSTALKAMSNLPTSKAADAAFYTFLLRRNNLERALNAEGLDEVNDRLATIATQVLGRTELQEACLKIAFGCAKRLQQIYEEADRMHDKTQAQLADLKRLLDRAVFNMRAINKILPESRLARPVDARAKNSA